MKMNEDLEKRLKSLRLTHLLSNWDKIIADVKRKNPSYTAWLKKVIDEEFSAKQERGRLMRLKRAKIEEPFQLDTYPFHQQPNLNKKRVQEIFDSNSYLTKNQAVILIGPTGVGKTGLGTSLLIHAINSGAKGRFITFPELLTELYRSMADHSEQKVLTKFINYSCLLIDEIGYIEINPDKAGLFFTLMKKRHKKTTTIITTQLGFKEWTGFLKNPHLTSALVDRTLSNAEVINMSKCESLRPNPNKRKGR
jgi:DNA replication protein DnaC